MPHTKQNNNKTHKNNNNGQTSKLTILLFCWLQICEFMYQHQHYRLIAGVVVNLFGAHLIKESPWMSTYNHYSDLLFRMEPQQVKKTFKVQTTRCTWTKLAVKISHHQTKTSVNHRKHLAHIKMRCAKGMPTGQKI